MMKYDLLVYLGLVPIVGTFIFAAYAVYSTSENADLEVRKMRIAEAVLAGLLALIIFSSILYYADAGGAGKEIFDKSYTVMLTLLGTIIGYIFGTSKK
jgi:hypothetical protein